MDGIKVRSGKTNKPEMTNETNLMINMMHELEVAGKIEFEMIEYVRN